jgi:hypothetical protein
MVMLVKGLKIGFACHFVNKSPTNGCILAPKGAAFTVKWNFTHLYGKAFMG